MTTLTPIAQIRQQYPRPRRRGDADAAGHAYCIGGAVCQSHRDLLDPELFDTDLERDFPGEHTLAYVLRDLNPALDADEEVLDIEQTVAFRFASHLTWQNDLGQFEEAWDLAARALTWQVGDPVPEEENEQGTDL